MANVTGGGRRPIAEGIEVGERPVSRPSRPPGRRRAILVSVSAVMIVGAMAISVVQLLGRPKDPGVDSRRRVAVDAVTGEVFTGFAIRNGDSQPWKNPKTGTRSLYPAESCFWTREGKAKAQPTYVLLNEYAAKLGPTLCPDCGRLVVGHNPLPPMELLAEAYRAKGAGEQAR